MSGCAAPVAPTYRIGFSQCTNGDAWRQAMLAGMKEELSFYPQVRFQMKDAHDNSRLQQQHIQEFLKEGIDLLIVSANEAEPITPIVEEAFNRAIPVVILDRRTTSKLYTAYVGGNNLEVGQTAGRYARGLLGERGPVLEVLGAAGASPAVDRHRGFGQALAAAPGGGRVVTQVRGDWKRPSVLRALPAALWAHPEVSLVFAHNDRMALGAYQVCKQLGLSEKVRIIGVDGLAGPQGDIQLVQDKVLAATLLYPPGGEEAIRTAMKILRREPFEKENILSTMVIDSTNVLTMKLQTEKLAEQQQDIERQQRLLQAQRATYSSQQNVLYVLAAALLGAVVLGSLAWRAYRANRRITRVLAGQNQEIRSQRNQILALAEQARVGTEAKLRFFTNFSHELRTPLTLMGPVEELFTNGADLTAPQRHDLGLVRRNTQRLLQLVNQLLDFCKIDVGKMPVRATEGNLVAFVRDIVDVFERPARQRGIRLRFLPAEPGLRVWFDVNVLDKVLFNLLSNALKFTPERGQITVSIQPLPTQKQVRISVEDTGCGISEQDRAHIFEWFYQGQPGAARGSGMGLALAIGLTRLHQGELTFTSAPGQGSTFVVTLPLELPAELRSPAAAASAGSAGSPSISLPPSLAQTLSDDEQTEEERTEKELAAPAAELPAAPATGQDR